MNANGIFHIMDMDKYAGYQMICQNSLDAAVEGSKEPVIVEFKQHEISSSDIPGYNEYRLSIEIGQKVNVQIKETGEFKTISIKYLPNSNVIPPLAKSLLSRCIGDEVVFRDKTYKIDNIQN